MTTVAEVFDKLREARIGCRADDGKILLDAPTGALTSELREQVRTHKAEMLALIARPTVPCTVCGRFAFREPTICCWCRRRDES